MSENQYQNNGTWVCPKCNALNHDLYCETCGFKRNIPGNSKFKGSNPWKMAFIALIVVALAILFINGSFSCLFGHKFEEATCVSSRTCSECGLTKGEPLEHNYAAATCVDPQICSDCGRTKGDPLGHDYTAATCAKAAECKRCNHVNGSPLAHNWNPATYTSPKKCTVCGKTEGNVKGYYRTLSGSWQEKRVSVGGTNTTPYVFDSTVKNCTQFTINFQIADVKSGDPFGKFTVHAKINGKWQKIGSFNANDRSEVVKTLKFEDPISFKQLAVVGPYRYSGNYTFYMWVEDFYLQD